MKFALAPIVSVFFALSAMGSPTSKKRDTTLEVEARQAQCDIATCLQTIGNETAGIIVPCGLAINNLANISQAIAQGQQPSQADVTGLTSNTVQCVFQSIAAGFAIPAACLSCVF
ncbi:hypothetical protein AGABI2DRAFT_123441 [Agaricus bisporus var. bisporus H97]|uniref:hypothetical protein n=1 Tax=Agaricus bisporus var. bisporus (strain H97 / ATCC MYA-4626 / FGSC 10389) TaxID=936046 RepID=UPI00029F7BE6|nr:hypothetical protein AGABI2DRAFT_123441 [Agaricus bisporus var. bisporus H97]EKV41725.1 hypothetical protein AGABI2DRAFT_123441 [Agaricus bisporus var. bisporus H97]